MKKPISEARFTAKHRRKSKKNVGRTHAEIENTPKLSPAELLQSHSARRIQGLASTDQQDSKA